MPLPTYNRKFTPRQLNTLVDDAVRGVFIPMGQGEKFEKALWSLARNPQRTEDDIALVRDMTKYNWRAAAAKAEKAETAPEPALRQLRATHVTNTGKLAANIREGVYLVEGQLPFSDIEARLRGITFTEIAGEEQVLHISEGMLSMALAYQHPALAH